MTKEAAMRIAAIAQAGLEAAGSAIRPELVQDDGEGTAVALGLAFVFGSGDALVVECLSDDMATTREMARFPRVAELDAARAAVLHVIDRTCSRAMEERAMELGRKERL